jgi:4-amino-4-deoxy-L-arabinose transferase-like glycosyltransferase
MSPRAPDPLLLLVLLVFGVTAGWYALATPIGEAPDELPHFQYLDFLRHERRLPDRFADGIYQDHHPPLYYGLAALFYDGLLRLEARGVRPRAFALPGPYRVAFDPRRPAVDRARFEESRAIVPEALRPRIERALGVRERYFALPSWVFHGLRLFSVACGLATLVCVHGTARAILAGGRAAPLAATAAFAALPQFGFLSGVINCDNLAILLGAWTMLRLARGIVDGGLARPGVAFRTGVVGGLAALAKMSGVALLPAVLLGAALAGGRGRRLLPAAAALAGFVLACGWWYARNALRYGDPFMVAAQAATMPEQIRQYPMSARVLADFLVGTVRSFFGILGRYEVPLAGTAYLLFFALAGAAAAGLARRAAGARRVALAPGGGRALAVLVAATLLLCGVVVAGNLTFWSSQGRYLFPAAPALALLFVLGLQEALGVGPRAWLALALVLFAVDAHTLFRRFLPTYHPLRSKYEGARVLHYEDAGHPRLAPHLRFGFPHETWGSFGRLLDPRASVAFAQQGGHVVFQFDDLPADRDLRVRLLYYASEVPIRRGDFPYQELVLNGAPAHAAVGPGPRPREFVYPVLARGRSLEVRLRPALGDAVAVSELWVEEEDRPWAHAERGGTQLLVAPPTEAPWLALRCVSLAAPGPARVGDREADGGYVLEGTGTLVDATLPAVPAGDWEWRLRFRGAPPVLEVGGAAFPAAAGEGTGWRELRAAWTSAGGAPRVRIRTEAEGRVALDLLRLDPVVAPGVNAREVPAR